MKEQIEKVDRRRYLKYLGLLVVGAAIFVGIVAYYVSLPNNAPEPALKIGVGVSTWLDPLSSSQGGQAAYLVYETLVYLDKDIKFKPLLAESWKVSEDGKIYTFHLRKDVKFSDGTPLTAEDVKFSIEYWKKWFPPSWSGIEEMKIEVIDEHTVRFVTDYKWLLFKSHFFWGIIKPITIDTSGRVTKAIGTGPFIVEDYVRAQSLILVKNGNYWGGDVNCTKIILKVIPDASTRSMALETGGIDMIGVDVGTLIPTEDITRLMNNPNLTVIKPEAHLRRIMFMPFNTNIEPFNDLQVRKAICYAVNKDEINIILGESGHTITGPVTPENPWYDPTLKEVPYDPEKAKELLINAGWRDTDGDGILDKNGKPFTVDLVTSFEFPQWPRISEVMQAQMKKIGIDVRIRQLERGAHAEAFTKGNFDMTITVDWGVALYPWHDFTQFYSPSPRVQFYKNDTLAQLVKELYTLNPDSDEAHKLASEIQKIILENMPVALYYEDYRPIACNKRVKNFEPIYGWGSTRFLWKVLIEQS